MNDLLICSMGTAEDRAGILSARSNGQAYQYLLMLGRTQSIFRSDQGRKWPISSCAGCTMDRHQYIGTRSTSNCECRAGNEQIIQRLSLCVKYESDG